MTDFIIDQTSIQVTTFEVNFDRTAAESLIRTAGGVISDPINLPNSDFFVTTDDDARVIGMESIIIEGTFYKVGLKS